MAGLSALCDKHTHTPVHMRFISDTWSWTTHKSKRVLETLVELEFKDYISRNFERFLLL